MNANRNGVSTGASAMMAANSAIATTIHSRIRLASWFSSGAFINGWGEGRQRGSRRNLAGNWKREASIR
jgi:hypothetical protein